MSCGILSLGEAKKKHTNSIGNLLVYNAVACARYDCCYGHVFWVKLP